MHCLVAVARCRVQTRRYHCLINHIQSHRLTLYPHFPLFAVLFPVPGSHHPSREEDPPCHPSELSRAFSLIVSSHSHLSSLLSAAHPSAVPLSPTGPQLTLIYVIFSEHPHVTALQRTLDQACPMLVRNTRGMRFAGVMGRREREEGGRMRTHKRGRSVESPNGHPWSPRGDIRNVNRTNQSGTSWLRN